MKVATRDKVTKFFEVSDDEERALLAAIAQADRGKVVSWEDCARNYVASANDSISQKRRLLRDQFG